MKNLSIVAVIGLLGIGCTDNIKYDDTKSSNWLYVNKPEQCQEAEDFDLECSDGCFYKVKCIDDGLLTLYTRKDTHDSWVRRILRE